MTMTSCAFSGPVTMAGSLVVGNAEVISALALMQLAHPGAPVYYAAAQTAMDLRTGGYTGGGPEDFLFGAATNVLSDFYNVPLSMGAFATGAKEPDWQAAVDNAFSSFMASLTGSDMLLGCGLLNGSRILSYEAMVMDCEIYSIVHKMMDGITVNDDTLALDVIRAVGPGGNFLKQKHTRAAHARTVAAPLDGSASLRPVGREARRGARLGAGAGAGHPQESSARSARSEVGGGTFSASSRRLEKNSHGDTERTEVLRHSICLSVSLCLCGLLFRKANYAAQTGIA